MFENISILYSLIALPLLGSAIIALLPENKSNLIKTVGLCTSLITFLISLFLWLNFDLSTPKYQFLEHFFPFSFVLTRSLNGVRSREPRE